MTIIETVETMACESCLFIGVYDGASGAFDEYAARATYAAGMERIAAENGGKCAHMAGGDGDEQRVSKVQCLVCQDRYEGIRTPVVVYVLA